MARVLPAVMALLLLLPALALVVGPAAGQIPPEVTFTSIHDIAVDTDRTGLFNELLLKINLEVTREGAYTGACILTVEASGNTYVIDTQVENPWLEEGGNAVVISFPSEAVFRTGRSGVFVANIEIQKFDHPERWK